MELRRAIEIKRDGGELDTATWQAIAAGYASGVIDDAPMAALAMACAIRGMGDDEIFALTAAMVDSGETIVFPPATNAVDKHSSGGVGDSISLAVVPLVAACGVPVAKLSGRALGHTGGTLDKLEAIAGVRTDLSPDAFVAQIERIGCAIAAQSDRLVPADKKLYALRDRTGSVPSIGLICASIVSKKVAGGAGAFVFDVKVGRGAFMRSTERALELAEKLVALSGRFGRRASAFVSDMDEPLSPSIGTGLEILAARDFLRGTTTDARFAELVRMVAHELLLVGGVAPNDVAKRYNTALANGTAYEKLVALIEAQGGTRVALESATPAQERESVRASHDGFIDGIDAVALGEAARMAVERGGPFAGIRLAVRRGDAVRRGQALAELFGTSRETERVAAAFSFAAVAPKPRPLVDAIVRDAEAPAASNSGK